MAKLLLGSNVVFDRLQKTFVYLKDDFIKAQIVLAKHPNRIKTPAEASRAIGNYLAIKEEFFSLQTEEERRDFLMNLQEDQTQEEINETYKDFNEMKKCLLKYLENPEDRMAVIQSMIQYMEPGIKRYVDFTKDMIIEYFEDHGGLSTEMQERIEMVFNSMDFYFVDHYEESNVNGRSRHFNKDISVKKIKELDLENLLLILTHECAHALSNLDFTMSGHRIGNLLEEGMADVFSEQVLNYYFAKHEQAKIGMRTIRPEGILLMDTSYQKENSCVRSILYALEQTGEDIEAITRFVLGDKKQFLRMILGQEFLDRCDKDYELNPTNVDVSYKDVYSAHEDAYYGWRAESFHTLQNYWLPLFQMESMMRERTAGSQERKSVLNLEDGSFFNQNFIHNTYFDFRKLYDISPEEYREFREIYQRMQETENPLVRGIEKYIDSRYSELELEEISEYSGNILDASLELLEGIPNVGDDVLHVLISVLDIEMEKLMELEGLERLEKMTELRDKLYPRAVELFSSGTTNNALTALLKLEEFGERIEEAIEQEQEKEASREPLGGVMLSHEINEQNIRFGEVAAASFSFEHDSKQIGKSEVDI